MGDLPQLRGEIREFHSYGRLLRLRHLPIHERGVIVEIRMWPCSLKASLQEEEYEAFKGTLKSSRGFLSV
jgi:hypothetical protein